MNAKEKKKINDLIEGIGILSAQRKVIEDIIESKQEELVNYFRVHGNELMETVKCQRCEGTGKDLDGQCISCDGYGERYIFAWPKDPNDFFSCKVYEVTQRIANQTEARELLSKETFLKIFKPQGHRRVDIRPTAKGRASIPQKDAA
jgi:hypothetical protein